MSTPADYRAAVAEDQRLVILQVLAGAPAYTAHEHVLRTALGALGRSIDYGTLRSHLAWLDSRPEALITVMGTDTQVARLTLRGEDVALGRAHEPGVARPRP